MAQISYEPPTTTKAIADGHEVRMDQSYLELVGDADSFVEFSQQVFAGTGSAFLALSLQLTRPLYVLGKDRIIAVVTLINQSSTQVMVPYFRGLEFQVVGLDRHSVMLPSTHLSRAYDDPTMTFSRTDIPLQPNERIAFGVDIQGHLEISSPGRYVIYCKRRARDPSGLEVELISNTALLEVMADPENQGSSDEPNAKVVSLPPPTEEATAATGPPVNAPEIGMAREPSASLPEATPAHAEHGTDLARVTQPVPGNLPATAQVVAASEADPLSETRNTYWVLWLMRRR
jgi:hypothetical protein